MRDFRVDLIWTKIQIAITALGGWLGMFLGGCDNFLYALIILTAIDFLSGVLVAIEQKTLSSSIGFRGIARKVLMFCLVGIAHTLDTRMLGSGAALRTATICYFCSNQGLSVVENCTVLGLPVPEKVKDALAQLHKRNEKGKEENEKDDENEKNDENKENS